MRSFLANCLWNAFPCLCCFIHEYTTFCTMSRARLVSIINFTQLWFMKICLFSHTPIHGKTIQTLLHFIYLMLCCFTPDFRSINWDIWQQICSWWSYCSYIRHTWTKACCWKLDPGFYNGNLNYWNSFPGYWRWKV